MKQISLLIAFLLLAGLNACHHVDDAKGLATSTEEDVAYDISSAEIVDDLQMSAEVDLGSALPSEALPVSIDSLKKVIKNGSMTVECIDIGASKKSLDSLLKQYRAYYGSELLDNNDYRTSYTLSIRVPASNFEALIARIEQGDDMVTMKNINARDVTEEYMDLEMRLASRRQYLDRYRQLLSKASSVKDLIEIEEGIRKLQEEIESAEGRLRYLKDQVSYSTLDLTLNQEKQYTYKAPARDPFGERAKNSLGAGWRSTVNFVLYLISAWPSILIITALGIFIIRWRRRNKRKQQ